MVFRRAWLYAQVNITFLAHVSRGWPYFLFSAHFTALAFTRRYFYREMFDKIRRQIATSIKDLIFKSWHRFSNWICSSTLQFASFNFSTFIWKSATWFIDYTAIFIVNTIFVTTCLVQKHGTWCKHEVCEDLFWYF